MKAVVFHGPHDLRVEDVEYPQLDGDSVILKVVRASVCNGSDTALYSGRRDIRIAYPWMRLPWIIGHECAGHIIEVGKNVEGFKPGDRVASLKYGNAFAEFQPVVVEEMLIRIPDDMPYDEATFIEPLWTTMSHIGNMHPGDSVIVCGLGPSGLLLLQESIALGASRTCAVDRVPNRLRKARELGADVAVNVAEGDAESQIKAKFGEADVFVDATGFDVYDLGIRVLKTNGILIMYGVPDSGVAYSGTRAFFKKIQFRWGNASRFEETMETAMRFVAEGKVRLGAFTTHHFPLESAPEAIQLALDHPEEVIGVVIDVA